MIDILLIVSNNIESGGVEAYLMNVLTHINRDDLNIDILVPGEIVSQEIASKFRRIGCNIIEAHLNIGSFKGNFELSKTIGRLLDEKFYDVVHVNTANLRVEVIGLHQAKIHQVSLRIAHSHGTLIEGSFVKETVRNVLRKMIFSSATDFLACSSSAAEALVGKKHSSMIKIVRNGINAVDYKFNIRKRENIRREYGWSDRFVIGFIARISPEKNHLFFLNVLQEIVKQDNTVLLVVVGTGNKEYVNQLRDKVRHLNLENNSQFLGEKSNISELVQGMDIHVLPSKREALGIVNIEAQASGMRCICSDRVPKEADVTGLIDFIPLEADIDFWARKILEYRCGYERMDTTDKIIESGYDITSSSRVLDHIYNSALNNRGGYLIN